MSRPFEAVRGNAGWLLPLSLIIFFLALGAMSIRGKTPTIDEPAHFQYGMNVLYGNSNRFDDSKMPVTAINAIPARIAMEFPDLKGLAVFQGYFLPRVLTLAVSALAALLVFTWSKSLYGLIPGVFSLLLYVFDPNLLAHSQLVTTDLYAWGTITLAFFLLWRFAHARTTINGILCALGLGLSQVAKYSSLPVLGLSLAALLLFDLRSQMAAPHVDPGWIARWLLPRYLLYLLIGSLISLLVINVCFLFNRSFTAFGDYRFRSELFQSLQVKYPALQRLPVPVPYPYLEGLDWVIQRERTGEGYGMIYLLGDLRRGEGFRGYFLIASLFKVPIATQILLAAALGVYFSDRERRRNFFLNEVFLLLPVIFYVIYFNFFYRAQIGIRFYLVVFPLLYIFAGNLFKNWERLKSWQKSLSGAAVLYLVISVLAYYPYYLTYFNELVWDKTQTYRYLADSNLDWGQNKVEFFAYLKEHEGSSRPPNTPQAGHFIVSANHLVGIGGNPERYRWLRENFEPESTLANYYFIYHISPAQIEELCASTDYCVSAPQPE
jgi:hypothetical protein